MMDSATKDRWLLRLFVLTLFAAGFFSGAIATRLAHIHGYFASASAGSDSMDWVIQQAALTPQQRTVVVGILKEHFASNKERMTRQMKRQYRDRFMETDQRLRQVLTPDQHRRYRKAMNQWIKRRAEGLRVQ